MRVPAYELPWLLKVTRKHVDIMEIDGNENLRIGCGHTVELNRDLPSKSRLTSNHDLAESRDLICFDQTTELIAICHCSNLSIMRKTRTDGITVSQQQNWLLFLQISYKK